MDESRTRNDVLDDGEGGASLPVAAAFGHQERSPRDFSKGGGLQVKSEQKNGFSVTEEMEAVVKKEPDACNQQISKDTKAKENAPPAMTTALDLLNQYMSSSSSQSEESDSESDSDTEVENVTDFSQLKPPGLTPQPEYIPPNDTERTSVKISFQDSSDSSGDSSSCEDNDELWESTDSSEGVASAVIGSVASSQKPARTKGELTLDDLPPIQDLQISVPEEDCFQMGTICSIVEQLVMVVALPGMPVYDIDTLFFLDNGRRPLGLVFDVLGRVTEPRYAIRFNSKEHALKSGAKEGVPVYCAPKTEHTSYVFVKDLLQQKGSDASWEHNNEPPEKFLDYSDDEQELHARRKARTNSGLGSDDQKRRKRSADRNRDFVNRMNARNLLMNERYPQAKPEAQGESKQKEVATTDNSHKDWNFSSFCWGPERWGPPSRPVAPQAPFNQFSLFPNFSNFGNVYLFPPPAASVPVTAFPPRPQFSSPPFLPPPPPPVDFSQPPPPPPPVNFSPASISQPSNLNRTAGTYPPSVAFAQPPSFTQPPVSFTNMPADATLPQPRWYRPLRGPIQPPRGNFLRINRNYFNEQNSEKW